MARCIKRQPLAIGTAMVAFARDEDRRGRGSWLRYTALGLTLRATLVQSVADAFPALRAV
jgi:hypothetical protein